MKPFLLVLLSFVLIGNAPKLIEAHETVAPSTATDLAERKVATLGDALLSGPVFSSDVAHTQEEFSLIVGEFNFAVTADTLLFRNYPDEETAEVLGANNWVYCGALSAQTLNGDERRKGMRISTANGYAIVPYRFYRLCFIDEGGDGDFDRVFVYHAANSFDKLPQSEIHSTPYSIRGLVPHKSGSDMILRVLKLDRARGKLRIGLEFDTDNRNNGRLDTVTVLDGDALTKSKSYVDVTLEKAQFPVVTEPLLGARIEIHSYDKATGSFVYHVNHNFSKQRFVTNFYDDKNPAPFVMPE